MASHDIAPDGLSSEDLRAWRQRCEDMAPEFERAELEFFTWLDRQKLSNPAFAAEETKAQKRFRAQMRRLSA